MTQQLTVSLPIAVLSDEFARLTVSSALTRVLASNRSPMAGKTFELHFVEGDRAGLVGMPTGIKPAKTALLDLMICVACKATLTTVSATNRFHGRM